MTRNLNLCECGHPIEYHAPTQSDARYLCSTVSCDCTVKRATGERVAALPAVARWSRVPGNEIGAAGRLRPADQ